MSKYTVGKGAIGAQKKTLVGGAGDEVVFVEDQSWVEVTNSDGAADFSFTVDKAAPSEVGDPDAYYMPACLCSITVPSPGPGETAVRLLSDASVKYSVAKGREA